MVVHRLSTIFNADEIIVMENGKLSQSELYEEGTKYGVNIVRTMMTPFVN